MPDRFLSGVLPLLLFCGLLAAAPARAEEEFSPMDKLELRVVEWLPARGEYRKWDALGGEYSVSANRTISLPFLGEVSVEGLDGASLSARLAQDLQERMSLAQTPDVSIAVAERAPIYVLGAVSAPGAVEFMPGMTVRQAIALAGGLYRASGAEMRLERDAITASGALADARDRAVRLRAKVARLELEVGTETNGELPAFAPSADIPAEFIAEEDAIRHIRAQVHRSRIESFESRRAIAQDQIRTLEEKRVTVERQIELTREELQNVSGLVDRGLAVTTRASTLERTLADLESRMLDLDLATLDANLAINESERGILDVDTSFRIEAAGELQAARLALASAEREVGTAGALLREATLLAPSKNVERSGDLAVRMQVFVSPFSGGEPHEVDLDTPLSSRDTVEIRLRLDDPVPARAEAGLRNG